MVTIILSDDHLLIRQGCRALLEKQPEFQVLADTGNALALSLVEQLKPDVVIIDFVMPNLNELALIRHITNCSSSPHVIVLSMHSDEAFVRQAMMHGAKGYVLKSCQESDLVQAVHKVMAGEHHVCPVIFEDVLNDYLNSAREETTDVFDKLTSRELETLQLVAKGLTSRQIAKLLSISHRTVEIYRSNLMRKLNLRSRTDLIRFAIRHSILHEDQS